MMARCSNPVCDSPRDGAGRYCRACHAAYMRSYRRGNHPLRNPHVDHIVESAATDDETAHIASAVACLEAP